MKLMVTIEANETKYLFLVNPETALRVLDIVCPVDFPDKEKLIADWTKKKDKEQ